MSCKSTLLGASHFLQLSRLNHLVTCICFWVCLYSDITIYLFKWSRTPVKFSSDSAVRTTGYFGDLRKMAPVYKVHYFDIHGRAEPIRLLLTYGNLNFEDKRYSQEEWAKFKPSTPLGQMPCLEVDGKLINQSTPICRYLGKVVGLGGKDNWEDLLIDVAVENLGDLHKKIMEMAFEQDAGKKKSMEEDLVKKDLPFFLEKFEETAKKNGGYFALNRLSWADIMFTCAYETYKNVISTDVWPKYPNLLKVKDNVLKVQSLQDWIKKRPANKMFSKFDLKQEL